MFFYFSFRAALLFAFVHDYLPVSTLCAAKCFLSPAIKSCPENYNYEKKLWDHSKP